MASLWSVDDGGTAELMGRFYPKLLGGKMTPSAALRAAQREMLQSSQWHSPYYWAAFELQGEWK
jgi:CHAT domain-containing protein